MGVKPKKVAEVYDLLINTDYDLVQIAYEVSLSVTQVHKIINDAKRYYQVNSLDLLVECLEDDLRG